MQINFQQLRSIMKESGLPVYRDEAPTTAVYPYIIYEFVNEMHKRSSSRILKSMPLYQIAVITKGTESDYEPLKKAFDSKSVEFSGFVGIPYDENDDTITQFITMVRCVNG
jgi:hypothetical protein